jgi:hypothetical protein
VAVLAAAVFVGVLASPRPSQAQLANPIIVGSLTNFDVENETEQEVEGFQIELEGVKGHDITRVFGESISGVCLTRFCRGTITDTATGVIIQWAGDWDPVTQQRTTRFNVPGMTVSPRTPVATNITVSGEDCWSLGQGSAYPTSGCEHFGVSTMVNPTKTTYRWLVAATFDPSVLVPVPGGPVAIPAPTAIVEPVDPTRPELGQAVVQVMDGLPSRTIKQYGDAEWVKVYKMDVGRKVDLDELMGGNPVVPMDAAHGEIEWTLLQHNRNSKGNSGQLRSKSGSGSSSHAVVRRYEFFKFTGQYDPDSHEAICADGVCDAPSPAELGAYIGSQMAAANLQAAARITLDRTVVGAGGLVTALVADGPALAGDWLGLYDGTGALVTSYRDWKYLNGGHGKPEGGGVANAAVTFTLPENPGTYQIRLFVNDSYTEAASSAPIVTTIPTVTLSETSVNAGATVTARITDGTGLPGDWIALYDTHGGPAEYLQWQYLNGSHARPANGFADTSVTFTAPSTSGTYNVRLFRNDSYALMTTSATITVTAPPPPVVPTPSVTFGPSTVGIGATVRATITNGTAKAGDWIGLYETNGGQTSYLQWQYLNGSQRRPAAGLAAASVLFTLPLATGTFHVRLFTNDSYALTATSAAVTAVPPTVTLSRADASTLTATIANGPGAPGDWIGLYNATGTPTQYLQWQFLDGSHNRPPNGAAATTLSFTVPAASGEYNVRLFSSDSYTLIATSATLVVP